MFGLHTTPLVVFFTLSTIEFPYLKVLVMRFPINPRGSSFSSSTSGVIGSKEIIITVIILNFEWTPPLV